MLIRCVFFIFLFNSSSMAEEAYGDLRLSELIDRCLVSLETDEDAAPYANELLNRTNFNLGASNQQRGLQCLEEVYSEPFVFERRKFVSMAQVLATQLLAEIDKAKESSQALDRSLRRQAVLQAIVDVCIEEYSRDRFRALTSLQCQEVFFETGLPEK